MQNVNNFLDSKRKRETSVQQPQKQPQKTISTQTDMSKHASGEIGGIPFHSQDELS